MCIKRHIVLDNGDIIPIQRGRALDTIRGAQNERPEVGNRAYNAVNAVRTAEIIKISGYSSRMIAIKAHHSGTRLIESLEDLMRRKSFSIESSSANLVPGLTLFVRITNHSAEDRFLFKDARVRYSDPLFGERSTATIQDEGINEEEQEFNGVQYTTGKPELSGLCPIPDDIQVTTYEVEETVEQDMGPGPCYATKLPSTSRGVKKTVEGIEMDELNGEEVYEVRELLRPFSAM